MVWSVLIGGGMITCFNCRLCKMPNDSFIEQL